MFVLLVCSFTLFLRVNKHHYCTPCIALLCVTGGVEQGKERGVEQGGKRCSTRRGKRCRTRRGKRRCRTTRGKRRCRTRRGKRRCRTTRGKRRCRTKREKMRCRTRRGKMRCRTRGQKMQNKGEGKCRININIITYNRRYMLMDLSEESSIWLFDLCWNWAPSIQYIIIISISY